MPKRTGGFSHSELEQAQARYGLRFPPDLVALLREGGIENGYDWSGENPDIHAMLAWPFDMLQFDIENGFWLPTLGERPRTQGGRANMLRQALDRAPKLIPLSSHRFLPDSPCEPGNPVFSMHGIDTIYYGADLQNYLDNELGRAEIGKPSRRIPFWSELVESFDEAYSFYGTAAAERDRGVAS